MTMKILAGSKKFTTLDGVKEIGTSAPREIFSIMPISITTRAKTTPMI
jgi:hypothetical protein